MLDVLKIRLARRAVALASRFVPRRAYEAKVARIIDQDAKNEGADLQGWEYLEVASSDGAFTHRYYHHPARVPGAPGIVFLHGLNLDGRNFLGMKDLAREHELFAYDFPEAAERYRGEIDDFAAMVDDFVDVMGLASYAVAGVSLGGMVALRHAGTRTLRRPGALILISTMIPGSTELKREQTRIVSEVVESLEDYQLYWLWELIKTRQLLKATPEQRATTSKVLRPKRLSFYRQVAAALRNYDGLDDARRVTCPTLVLLGTRDGLITTASAAELREAIPHARIELIRDARHDLSLQRPALICGHVWSFLDGIRARE
jgi:pimeloyl-ACP methyl ester carboxylesterase